MSALLRTIHHLLLPHPHNNHQARLLQVRGLMWLAILSVIFPLSLSVTPRQSAGKVLGYSSVINAQSIVDLTNQERLTNGLTPLEENSALAQAAHDKAQDMFANDYWAHVSPTGVQPWDFITKAGYQYLYAGENLARDFLDSPSVIEAWMDSPTHRDNLLNTHYTQIGVAVVEGTLNGFHTTLVVQEFGSPRVIAQINNDEIEQQFTKTQGAHVVHKSDVMPIQPVAIMPQNQPLVAPLDITKAWTIGIGGLMIIVLSIDIYMMNSKKIPRLASRPIAHLLFVLTMLVGIWYTQAGFIK